MALNFKIRGIPKAVYTAYFNLFVVEKMPKSKSKC